MTEAAGDVNPLTDITKMDFDAVDYCIRSIDECLNAPDSEIFVLMEAKTKEEDDDDDAVIMTVRDKKRLAQYDADADKRKPKRIRSRSGRRILKSWMSVRKHRVSLLLRSLPSLINLLSRTWMSRKPMMLCRCSPRLLSTL